MLAKIMKWVCLPALLLVGFFWRSAVNYEILPALVVCIGAIVVIWQAVQAKEYLWAVGFVALALIFNPVVPVLWASSNLFLLMALVCIASFAIFRAAWKAQPLLLIPSIRSEHTK